MYKAENSRYIGFHARSMEELRRVTGLPGVNLVELKPYDFRKANEPIYCFDGKSFIINEHVASQIRGICSEKEISVQVHLPFENKNNPAEESGLCQALKEHHGLILQRFDMFGKLLGDYGIGTILTMHPPAFGFDDKDFCSEEEALEAGMELCAKVDKLIREGGYCFQVGLENMMDPKNVGSRNIGYKTEHLRHLIEGMSYIGITVDSGHSILADEVSVDTLFETVKVVNLHFHSNPGKKSLNDYSDDAHLLATKSNMKNFDEYIQRIRNFNVPVILEVESLGNDDKFLVEYVAILRALISRTGVTSL